MAGDLPNFDPDAFRTAIRGAMDMGAPEDEALRATFYFPPDVPIVDEPVDPSGVPFGPNATVARQPRRHVQVSCGIETGSAASVQTSIGRFSGDTVVITLLDDDYEQVAGDGTPEHPGFEFVVIGGIKYRYIKELVPRGLGSVTIHQIECAAEDSA